MHFFLSLDSIEGPGNSSEALVQQSSLVTDLPERPKAVKRLNLESLAIDSGVGSSVDSNGDSRDSMDHRGEVIVMKQLFSHTVLGICMSDPNGNIGSGIISNLHLFYEISVYLHQIHISTLHR